MDARTAALSDPVTTGSGCSRLWDTALSGCGGGDEYDCVACGRDVCSRRIHCAPSVRLKKDDAYSNKAAPSVTAAAFTLVSIRMSSYENHTDRAPKS